MRLSALALLPVLLWVSAPAYAQNSDLKNLWREVTSGDVVRVKEASGQETRGVFAKVSESGLSMLVDGKTLEIPASQVREVRRRGDSAMGGLMVGAVIGGGTAAALFYKCSEPSRLPCLQWTRGALLGAGIGAGVGAAIDGAVSGWTVAFRDNGTSFVLHPSIVPTPLGVLAQIRITTR